MGPYCQFCGRRCFVPRWIPGEGTIDMATCKKGVEHDLKSTGHTFETAVNPNNPLLKQYVQAIRVAERTQVRSEIAAAANAPRAATVTVGVERTDAERAFHDEHGMWPDDMSAMAYCTCVEDCAEDPPSSCSLSGIPHVHPNQYPGDVFGPCPVHPDAPGDR